MLGKGSFGTVLKAKMKGGRGEIVAVKSMDKEGLRRMKVLRLERYTDERSAMVMAYSCHHNHYYTIVTAGFHTELVLRPLQSFEKVSSSVRTIFSAVGTQTAVRYPKPLFIGFLDIHSCFGFAAG